MKIAGKKINLIFAFKVFLGKGVITDREKEGKGGVGEGEETSATLLKIAACDGFGDGSFRQSCSLCETDRMAD